MSPVWTFYPSRTAPTTLDVVWCRFPFVEDPGTPNPKPRPALVRSVIKKEGKIYVEVAYGTSKLNKFSDEAPDLFVTNYRDMLEAGTPQATVFLLGRTVILPWASEWFAVLQNFDTPVVGHLSARSIEFLNFLLKQARRPRT